MPLQAYVTTFHPGQSGQVSRLSVHVHYARGEASIDIDLSQPLSGHTPFQEAIAGQFRALAEALVRIADKPATILSHDLRRS